MTRENLKRSARGGFSRVRTSARTRENLLADPRKPAKTSWTTRENLLAEGSGRFSRVPWGACRRHLDARIVLRTGSATHQTDVLRKFCLSCAPARARERNHLEGAH
jgi:hypothetical protein